MARFPQRFKVEVNVEGEGNRDDVIDLIGLGSFPEKGTESAPKPVVKRGGNPCLISASPDRTNKMQRLVGLLVRAEYLPYGVSGWTALAEVVAGC